MTAPDLSDLTPEHAAIVSAVWFGYPTNTPPRGVLSADAVVRCTPTYAATWADGRFVVRKVS